MATPASFVWVQVYYEEQEEPDGNAFFIETASLVPPIVGALAKAVKKELKLDAPLNMLYVYSPGTKPPFAKKKCIRPGMNLQELTTSDEFPLIVVAPPPPQQPPANVHPLRPLLSEEVIATVENSVCVLVENDEFFGSGFAVSNSRVYTAAHHWEEEDDDGETYFAVKVGDTVECIHGKPSANKRYNLQVVKLDERLDYCILEITGDHRFTNWLETDVSPKLTLTTPVFLAAYQIGIQASLDQYEMGVTMGITSGIIVRIGDRHMVHSCASFKGDSGGAIVISNGKVIGLHMAAVNEARNLMDLTQVDFGSVSDSIDQLCAAQSTGSVALLVSAIEP